ncbi:Variant SH3 domain containing protein [Aphelenchoides avenae]|nr:Variant SH3 domain containing protein [Aphelenchus avenae]
MAGKPPVHHVFSSASNGLSVPSYNGGFRGSTQDKRKFFELVAQKQVPDEPPPRRQHVPRIKCKTSDRFLDMVAMERSVASDAGTEISGYDSVAPDFAMGRESRQLASGNLTPVSSIDPSDDQWMDAHRCYSSESEASVSLVKENVVVRRPKESTNVVFDESNSQSVIDQQKAAEIDNAIASVTQDITTLQNLHAMQCMKDSVVSNGNAQCDMHDPSARSSIEIPQYQGVAELRNHIGSKLDMKTPTGARPQAPPIVHNRVQPHRSCVTPMPAPTYSTTTVPNPSRRLSVSFIHPPTADVKDPIPAGLHGVDTYRLQYDSDDLSTHDTEYSGLTANSATKEFAWQCFSGGQQEATPTRCSIDTGYSSEVSPKDKPNRADGFNAHQGLLIRADYLSVKNDDGSMETSQPTDQRQQHVVYSETGAPFSATTVPGVDGRLYMLGDSTPTPPANVEEAIKNAAPEDSPQKGANTLACEAHVEDGRNDDPELAQIKAESEDIEPREKPLELTARKSDLSPSSGTSASHLPIRPSPDLSAADCTGPRAELPDALAQSPPPAALHCDGVTAAFSANINSSSVHSKHDADRRSFAQPARGLENCSGASIRTEQSRPEADIFDRRADQHACWHQQQEAARASRLPAVTVRNKASGTATCIASCMDGLMKVSPRSQTPSMSFRDDRENAYHVKSETLPRRSKSTPRYDPVADMELVDRFAISQRQAQQARSNMDLRAQSTSSGFANTSALYNGSHNLPSGSNSLGRLSKDAMLHQQRAEKLSEELVDQQSRRHGYVPNSTVSLQNNLNRLEHLLTDFGRPSSRSSTPLRSGSAGAPQVQTCTALYRFVASSPRELSLNRGDVLRIRREVDSNWFEGERHGQVGIFPSSYVQVDDDPSTNHSRVRAIYPFQARNANEMSLKPGDTVRLLRSIDANWVEGINAKSGQIGIFPKSYVRHADEVNGGVQSDLVPDRPKTPKTVGSLLSRGASPSMLKRSDHSQEVQAWEQRRLAYGSSGPAHIPRNAEIYRAIFSYKPEHPDELELVENDIVFVVEKCDDGWYIGTLLRTGQYGTFPGNFVVKH